MKKGIVNFLVMIFFLVVTVNMSSSCEAESELMDINKTILIYMAADNNLSSFADKNLESIKEGYVPEFFSSGRGDVLLVFVDKRHETPKLLRLSKDEFDVVHTEVVAEYEEFNSVSDTVMYGVLRHAAQLFPARENGLILWSHGTGWMPERYYAEPYTLSANGVVVPTAVEYDPYASYVKSFGLDDNDEMDIIDLANALPIHYSFVLFDACLMAGIEVAYEIKDDCDYMVASAAEILAEGFPYKTIMEPLFKYSVPHGLIETAKMYYNHYNSMGEGATVSVVDMAEIHDVAQESANIFANGRNKISDIDMSSLQGFFRQNRHWFYDIDDFMSRIATSAQYEYFHEAMSDFVLYNAATESYNLGGVPQFHIKNFSGLSTYVPNPENSVLDEYYKKLAWNKAVRMIE